MMKDSAALARTMVPFMPYLFLVALLAAPSPALAQVTPTSSEDPLNGSTFSTTPYTPSNTFTATTTFASAATSTPTSIVGVGPSVSSDTYTYSYDGVQSTVSGTDLSNLYSSLAAASTPTAATSALTPNPSNLQIVADSATRLQGGSSAFAGILVALFTGAGFALVLLA